MTTPDATDLATRATKPWFVYLIECADGSIYTGIALDVAARFAAHASGTGARYTRSHPPTRVIATFAYPDKSAALKAEYRIRRLPAREKRALGSADGAGASGAPGHLAQ